MKLYYHPVSTVCRSVLQFCVEEKIDYEPVLVDLMKGEHCQPAFTAINPNQQVPVLEDDGWLLSESSAILKYLADKVGSAAYPKDLRARARVNEMMDWFNTGFYRELGYHLIYPQLFPHHRREPEAANQATVNWGRDHSAAALRILNDVYLGKGKAYLCGDTITLADYFAAAILTVGELIGNDLSAWPNVQRWLNGIKARPSWNEVNTAHAGFVDMLKGKPFVCLPCAASAVA
jgi:glutathione S-transferase